MPKLILVCGLPCCGKTTFINQVLESDYQATVSKNEIRLSLCKNDTSKFGKEILVNNIFIDKTIQYLNDDYDVYVEDNFNTLLSRSKFLTRIPKNLYDELEIYYLDLDVSNCIYFNEKNKDTINYVNPKMIRAMADNFSEPEYQEGYDNIYIRDFHYNYYRKREK